MNPKENNYCQCILTKLANLINVKPTEARKTKKWLKRKVDERLIGGCQSTPLQF
jgi:hypothetical protein